MTTPAHTYDTLKVLADTAPTQNRGDAAIDWIPSKAFAAIDLIAGGQLYAQARAALETRQLDAQIADELLRYVSEGRDSKGEYSRLAQLLHYSEALHRPESEEARASVRQAIIGAISLWPVEQQMNLESARRQLLERLETVHAEARRFIQGSISMEQKNPEQKFEEHFGKLLSYIAKHLQVTAESKAEIMQNRAAMKRRRQCQDAGRNLEESMDSTNPLPEKEPKRLVWLRVHDETTLVADPEATEEAVVAETMKVFSRTDP